MEKGRFCKQVGVENGSVEHSSAMRAHLQSTCYVRITWDSEVCKVGFMELGCEENQQEPPQDINLCRKPRSGCKLQLEAGGHVLKLIYKREVL